VAYFSLTQREHLSPEAAKPFPGARLMLEELFYTKCVKTNLTAFEATREFACNYASKTHPVLADIELFGVALRNAVESIGAFSGLNAAWARIAPAASAPRPPWLP